MATIRCNNKRHVSKELRKEIMRRSRLKKIPNESGRKKDIRRYKLQRNKVVKLNKPANLKFCQDLNISDLTDDKRFWKSFKPLFTPINQEMFHRKVTLVGNESIVSYESHIAQCFNQYFTYITDSLPIESYMTIAKCPMERPYY